MQVLFPCRFVRVDPRESVADRSNGPYRRMARFRSITVSNAALVSFGR